MWRPLKACLGCTFLVLVGCASQLGDIDFFGETPTASPTNSPGPSPTPNPNPVVFVSSQTWTAGELLTPLGGDSFCTTAGMAGGYFGGIFRSWIAGETFDAHERLFDQGPWQRTDGTPVFADEADIDNGPAVAITFDEFGSDIGTVQVWTGANADGTLHPDNCSNWTVDTGLGLTGSSGATDGTWTASASVNCNTALHLYCFEQTN